MRIDEISRKISFWCYVAAVGYASTRYVYTVDDCFQFFCTLRKASGVCYKVDDFGKIAGQLVKIGGDASATHVWFIVHWSCVE